MSVLHPGQGAFASTLLLSKRFPDSAVDALVSVEAPAKSSATDLSDLSLVSLDSSPFSDPDGIRPDSSILATISAGVSLSDPGLAGGALANFKTSVVSSFRDE